MVKDIKADCSIDLNFDRNIEISFPISLSS
jgi:hypothetical protein